MNYILIQLLFKKNFCRAEIHKYKNIHECVKADSDFESYKIGFSRVDIWDREKGLFFIFCLLYQYIFNFSNNEPILFCPKKKFLYINKLTECPALSGIVLLKVPNYLS